MENWKTPWASTKGSTGFSHRYLLKDLRVKVPGLQRGKRLGFTQRAYILLAIDLDTLSWQQVVTVFKTAL
jgi:hypothetical protein